jgi:hypothetical protein
MRHFLGCPYKALYRAKKTKWISLKISEKMDLSLLQSFLDYAKEGISLNNIVFRRPTHIYRSDASEFGIRGYNLISGKAWRFEIPTDCHLQTTLNSLEFIACMITIWIDMLSGNIEYELCILSQTDSSTAAGWLRKSNFTDSGDEIVQMTTARHLANLTIQHKCCLYSQWFPGDENVVSDALSRDFHLSNTELSNMITTFTPKQVPFGIKIQEPAKEISSWLICLLQNQPAKEQWSKVPTRSSLYHGCATETTCLQSDAMTHTSKVFPEHNAIESWQHLLMHYKKEDLVLELTKPSKQIQSEPPWIMRHRPLSWLTSPTQDWTTKVNLHSFYSDNYKTTPITIHQNDSKQQ